MAANYWRYLALQKWPGAEILGFGRFAVKCSWGNQVYLCPTREDAEKWCKFCDAPTIDLQPVDLNAMPDHKDHDELRRERREARQAAK
jgi:hypothetical protein